MKWDTFPVYIFVPYRSDCKTSFLVHIHNFTYKCVNANLFDKGLYN